MLRAIYALVLFGALSVVVIGLRSEQIRFASAIEQHHRDGVALRRRAWALQMEIGRVRNPQQVRDRVARWSLDVGTRFPPSDEVSENQLLVQR